MAMPYKKENALLSPTSALEEKQMLSRLDEELRIFSDGQRQTDSRETLGARMRPCRVPSNSRGLGWTRDWYNL
jgi:hypothetical protein